MRNLTFAVFTALAVALFVTFAVIGTGLNNLVSFTVFSSEESFWASIALFVFLNVAGVLLLPKR